eukprot:487400_1
MTALRTFALLTILLTQCIGDTPIPGGWSDMKNTSKVQQYVHQINNDIIKLLNHNGYDIKSKCSSTVIAAQDQVVAGMNYRALIEICGQYAEIKFFVPLPINNNNPKPQDIEIISSRGENSVNVIHGRVKHYP